VDIFVSVTVFDNENITDADVSIPDRCRIRRSCRPSLSVHPIVPFFACHAAVHCRPVTRHAVTESTYDSGQPMSVQLHDGAINYEDSCNKYSYTHSLVDNIDS